MKAKEAILMSKLGKKKLPTTNPSYKGEDLVTADKIDGTNDVPKTNSVSPAKSLIGATKIKGSFDSTTGSLGKFMEPKQEYEAQVELGPTETQGYSPVADYLKKRKGK